VWQRHAVPPTLRPADRGDLAAIVAVYADYDLANRGAVDSGEDDVLRDWEAPGFPMHERTRVLVDDGGEVVGYAVASPGGDADSVARPGRGGDDALLGWLESLGEPLRHHLPASDDEGSARMGRRGWVADRTYWRMRIDLDGPAPTPPPAWPDGYTSTALDVERHGPAVHELIQTAFADIGDDQPREEYGPWAAWALAPGRYDPDLCRVVARRDGTVVAADVCHLSGDAGFVRQLAVAAAARGRGLGLALLHDVFRHARDRGLAAVELGVDRANATGAPRLYERAGMRVTEAFTRWRWTPAERIDGPR
jgi:GNAT superfamily N-acetyltransferase